MSDVRSKGWPAPPSRREPATPAAEPGIPAERMAAYRAGARRREETRARDLALRREQAWRLARLAAETLRTDFGAGRIVAFGSLLHAEQFHERSDVDLAVWGVPESEYFLALGRLLGLDPLFSVDLVRVEDAPPRLLAAIRGEGVDL